MIHHRQTTITATLGKASCKGGGYVSVSPMRQVMTNLAFASYWVKSSKAWFDLYHTHRGRHVAPAHPERVVWEATECVCQLRGGPLTCFHFRCSNSDLMNCVHSDTDTSGFCVGSFLNNFYGALRPILCNNGVALFNVMIFRHFLL
jgi:hypothetical protein